MKAIGALIAFACFSGLGVAQAADDAAKPCGAAEQRQLDFWVGRWDVFRAADDERVATSDITLVAGACAVSEHFVSATGNYEGLSYSAFDAKDGKWLQFYVDTTGKATSYAGAFDGAAMVMFAHGPQALQKMTYRPEGDGSVRQTGEFSIDDGATWRPGYGYVYRPRSRP